jgi:hypothetical protein
MGTRDKSKQEHQLWSADKNPHPGVAGASGVGRQRYQDVNTEFAHACDEHQQQEQDEISGRDRT